MLGKCQRLLREFIRNTVWQYYSVNRRSGDIEDLLAQKLQEPCWKFTISGLRCSRRETLDCLLRAGSAFA